MTLESDEVLSFWFEENGTEQWFGKEKSFDEKIRVRFYELMQRAREGELESWIREPRTCLALIILIDQFSRNLYRNSPLSWSADSYALALSKQAIEKNYDNSMNHNEKAFLYLPLMHSEVLEDQDLCVKLVERTLVSENEFNLKNYESALRHQYIIARFGRFPHRNKILGRISTKEEIEFLKEPNSSF